MHWLPVEQQVGRALTFKTQQTSSPQYLSQHISLRTSARNTRSSSVPGLCVPFRLTSFAVDQHCHTSDLELTAICCVKLRLSLYFQIQTYNSSVFYRFLLTILPTCFASASVAA